MPEFSTWYSKTSLGLPPFLADFEFLQTVLNRESGCQGDFNIYFRHNLVATVHIWGDSHHQAQNVHLLTYRLLVGDELEAVHVSPMTSTTISRNTSHRAKILALT